MRILEIGGGSGFQASLMTSWGCKVVSLDIKECKLTEKEFYYPIQIYDGRNIPYSDKSFDRIFSSSVLEHISPLELNHIYIRRNKKSLETKWNSSVNIA